MILGGLFVPLLALWALSCWPPSGSFGLLRPYLAAAMVGSALFSKDRWYHRVLTDWRLGYVATVSFALYVWHPQFFNDWFSGDGTIDRYLIKRPIGFALTFLFAHFSTFYFEKPITEWVRRKTESSASRD